MRVGKQSTGLPNGPIMLMLEENKRWIEREFSTMAISDSHAVDKITKRLNYIENIQDENINTLLPEHSTSCSWVRELIDTFRRQLEESRAFLERSRLGESFSNLCAELSQDIQRLTDSCKNYMACILMMGSDQPVPTWVRSQPWYDGSTFYSGKLEKILDRVMAEMSTSPLSAPPPIINLLILDSKEAEVQSLFWTAEGLESILKIYDVIAGLMWIQNMLLEIRNRVASQIGELVMFSPLPLSALMETTIQLLLKLEQSAESIREKAKYVSRIDKNKWAPNLKEAKLQGTDLPESMANAKKHTNEIIARLSRSDLSTTHQQVQAAIGNLLTALHENLPVVQERFNLPRILLPANLLMASNNVDVCAGSPSPDSVESFMKQGLDLYKGGQWKRCTEFTRNCLDLCQSHMKTCPGRAACKIHRVSDQAHFLKARAHEQLDEFAEALDHYAAISGAYKKRMSEGGMEEDKALLALHTEAMGGMKFALLEKCRAGGVKSGCKEMFEDGFSDLKRSLSLFLELDRKEDGIRVCRRMLEGAILESDWSKFNSTESEMFRVVFGTGPVGTLQKQPLWEKGWNALPPLFPHTAGEEKCKTYKKKYAKSVLYVDCE